ncbi:MAG: ABC transporter ATP-binding protein [Alphaproteobacteria bacterium]|nr:ABC transporter ATP-binding protein [Alphaproteobacteria bacterium]
MNKVLELKNIQKIYGKGETSLSVLKDINFTISAGEVVALVGPSGSGKSTLLHVAGLLDAPTQGQIFIQGKSISKMSDNERTDLRKKNMGVVYQAHLLLPDFTALENVMMPQLIAGTDKKEAQKKALDLLDKVGLKNRATHRPGELSGGEQQRVAIARALANNPALLLADEPTGNLDPQTAENVFNLLMSLVRETGLSALIATHNPELANQMDRRISVQNGILVEE